MKKLVITTILSIICYVTFAQSANHFEICPEQPLQVMEHFSASDAWSMHIIGKWPQEKQNQVADWLFSTENDANGDVSKLRHISFFYI